MRTINVVAAVIESNGLIFCTQRGYGEWKDWWEFPGGKIEKGETPQEALKREIREELNCDISVGRLLGTVENDYPHFHISMHCFMCRLSEGSPRLLEHEAACWLPFDKLDTLKWLPADKEIIGRICLR